MVGEQRECAYRQEYAYKLPYAHTGILQNQTGYAKLLPEGHVDIASFLDHEVESLHSGLIHGRIAQVFAKYLALDALVTSVYL